MAAELLAASLGISFKSLLRAAVRVGVSITSATQVLTGGQQTNLTNDVISKERVGRPKNSRK